MAAPLERSVYQTAIDNAFRSMTAIKRHQGDTVYYQTLHANAERLFDLFTPLVPGLVKPDDGDPKNGAHR